jgi:surfeit locus 1 family protein
VKSFFFWLLTVITLGVLVGLGTWQLERKAWKEELISELETKLSAPPTNLPPRERWQSLDASKEEFRHVTFPAELLAGEEALVYSSGSPLRPDVSGPGYFVFSPARLLGGSLVVVNRGFVPEGKQDPKTRAEGQPSGIVEISGTMRWPEQRNPFTPKDDPDKSLWFARDPASMSAAKNWGNVAPFYVDQEGPPARGGFPKVGPLKPTLTNNHLQYAVTWYGLAGVMLITALFFWRSRRRSVTP